MIRRAFEALGAFAAGADAVALLERMRRAKPTPVVSLADARQSRRVRAHTPESER
jgi:hypothetical protein